MTTDPIPAEAVNAVEAVLTDAGVDLYDNVRDLARLALTAAAPLIADDLRASRDAWASRMMEFAEAQHELADLRAGIEALRDVTRLNRDAQAKNRDAMLRDGDIALAEYCKGRVFSYGVVLDALDALLRGAK